MPSVSIIIPALNEEATIAAAVAHARATEPCEVIVADGGSRDRTVQWAKEQGARVVVSRRGRARQQNTGVQEATGDVFLFLHADNWLHASGVRQITAALADREVLGGAFCQRIESSGLAYRLLERGNALRATWCRAPYGDQGIFVRRTLFQQLGGFPDVQLMEDLLLMRRFRRFARPVLLPGPLYVSPRRWQRNGVVRQTLRNWALVLAERLGAEPDRLARYYPPHCEADQARPRPAEEN
ncbi:MAG: TIGR04283 family arsenosugar biosynthesis glycosyltransferase [Planctomycetia bacterium]|nr:MAG: TIGR04283 family arsenosugar biosynthesis glycosyltransferase [Planctomycetia bacterium]